MKRTILLAIALGLTGCASAPNEHAHYQPLDYRPPSLQPFVTPSGTLSESEILGGNFGFVSRRSMPPAFRGLHSGSPRRPVESAPITYTTYPPVNISLPQ